MSAELLIKGFQIWEMLEIVGIQVTGFQSIVGLNVIGVLSDIQFIALLLQNRLCSLQNFCVGSRTCTYYDLFQLCRRLCGLSFSFG